MNSQLPIPKQDLIRLWISIFYRTKSGRNVSFFKSRNFKYLKNHNFVRTKSIVRTKSYGTFRIYLFNKNNAKNQIYAMLFFIEIDINFR